MHYSSAFIFVECKNYGKEIGNPELDQLSGRFSPNRGQVGFLVCRSILDEDRLLLGCIDTAKDSRGFIITITDDELIQIIEEERTVRPKHEYALLKKKFSKLIE
jgi:hypothetical protein